MPRIVLNALANLFLASENAAAKSSDRPPLIFSLRSSPSVIEWRENWPEKKTLPTSDAGRTCFRTSMAQREGNGTLLTNSLTGRASVGNKAPPSVCVCSDNVNESNDSFDTPRAAARTQPETEAKKAADWFDSNP